MTAREFREKTETDEQWIELIVTEEKNISISESVYNNLLKSLRLAKNEWKDVEPQKKKTSLVEFFNPQSSSVSQ